MISRRHKLRLLPPEALVKTGDVDHADWNYRPLLGAISRRRFRLILSLMEGQKFERLLEAGYGSGIFMPELAARCDELYGIDIHTQQDAVNERLASFGISARLFSGSITAMPFDNNFFDCVVGVSTFEFVEDLEAACVEVKRVLKSDGFLLVVTPGHSPVADLGLKILTGKNAREDFNDRREKIVATLRKHFVVQKQLAAPSLGNSIVRLYTALKLRAPEGDAAL